LLQREGGRGGKRKKKKGGEESRPVTFAWPAHTTMAILHRRRGGKKKKKEEKAPWPSIRSLLLLERDIVRAPEGKTRKGGGGHFV